MSEKQINLSAICDGCKQKFIITQEDFKEVEIIINNQPMTLIYFLCTHCFKGYKVALKNDTFQQITDEANLIAKQI